MSPGRSPDARPAPAANTDLRTVAKYHHRAPTLYFDALQLTQLDRLELELQAVTDEENES